MDNLRSQNDWALAEELEYAHLRTLTPAQTMWEFIQLYEGFRDRMNETQHLFGDEHRQAVIDLQAKLARLGRGPAA